MSNTEDGVPPVRPRIGPSGRSILSLRATASADTAPRLNPEAPLRHVLVLMSQMASVARCLDFAAEAISADDSSITAMPFELDGVPGYARQAAIQAAYSAWKGSTAHRCHLVWRMNSRDGENGILDEAVKTDLLVIDASDAKKSDEILRAVLATGRLTLVVADRPQRQGSHLRGHLAIAWKPGHHVAHAVEAAAPLLRRAEKVTVICVADEGKTSQLTAAAWIERLRLRAEIDSIAGDGHSVADRLIRHVDKIHADCLVIGARGRNNVSGRQLGEVTQTILDKTNLPLLLM